MPSNSIFSRLLIADVYILQHWCYEFWAITLPLTVTWRSRDHEKRCQPLGHRASVVFDLMGLDRQLAYRPLPSRRAQAALLCHWHDFLCLGSTIVEGFGHIDWRGCVQGHFIVEWSYSLALRLLVYQWYFRAQRNLVRDLAFFFKTVAALGRSRELLDLHYKARPYRWLPRRDTALIVILVIIGEANRCSWLQHRRSLWNFHRRCHLSQLLRWLMLHRLECLHRAASRIFALLIISLVSFVVVASVYLLHLFLMFSFLYLHFYRSQKEWLRFIKFCLKTI